MDTQEKAKVRLLGVGIKPSVQRLAIMEYLLTHPTHPTADTIYNDLSPSMPTLSKTTVYNTLKLLSEQGAILSLTIDEKNIRYDGDIATHAHFRCKECGAVYDLSVAGLDAIQLEGADNLVLTECQLYYKGYCETCKDKKDFEGL